MPVILRDAFPSSALTDCSDSGLVNGVEARNVPLDLSPCTVHGPYLKNLYNCQLVVSLKFSGSEYSGSRSFSETVHPIVKRSPDIKMCGVYARRVIKALAIMKNPFSHRNRTHVDQPTESVSCLSLMSNAVPKLTVSKLRFSTGPEPARFGFLHLGPKPVNENLGYPLFVEVLFRKVGLHIQRLFLMCHAPGSANCAGAFSVYLNHFKGQQNAYSR